MDCIFNEIETEFLCTIWINKISAQRVQYEEVRKSLLSSVAWTKFG